MTAEATFKALRCFADVLSTTTPGFSCNNVYQIWTVSVNVFVDLDAVSFAIDRGCYSWLDEIWLHVKHLLALQLGILENLLLIWLLRRKDFAVRPELETDWDLEFGEPKWRGESATLVVVNSFYKKHQEDEVKIQKVI